MNKRMLIDDTHEEETRVVILNNNKIEDVEFETASRKQIKGNIYLAKVMRVEPSLQAAFVDYGGNRHGFLAFGEIHPDYYTLTEKQLAEIDKEVDEAIEGKKQAIKDRELEREKARNDREAKAAAKMAAEEAKVEVIEEEVPVAEEDVSKDKPVKKRLVKKRNQKKQSDKEELKVMTHASASVEEVVCENVNEITEVRPSQDDDFDDDEDDDDDDFELQRKLLRVRKLYGKYSIQDVIKEGQIILVQVVKEERGNKGAALTTYLSLAGRYCVLMPNRIKSGGVSRKITSVSDRKRLKGIVRELPLTSDMSLIVRTAGEEKSKPDIVRDYNYLMRSWNQIRIEALKHQAPALIHEEGNLIKRALRDMYSKDISEIIVDGDNAFQEARDFTKILSPQNLKKLKYNKRDDIPLFQRYQVESQLEKLHDTGVHLESGGYLVINPTEALVAIDVNSGRATKEKDIEETALKTNLEAADEVARQLRLRNLAGLIVIDFIDMDEPKNNQAVERRMKEALKNDRARIQIGKMSCFGLMEISRQRMHSSFLESSYQVCPHCQGKGMIRTIESCAVLVLRDLEEEGIKNRSSKLNVFLPADVAIYLLNQKRNSIVEIENRYNVSIVISVDNLIQNIDNYRIERVKMPKVQAPAPEEVKKETEEVIEKFDEIINEGTEENKPPRNNRHDRRGNRRHGRNRRDRRDYEPREKYEEKPAVMEAISNDDGKKEKAAWWKKLIKKD